MRRHQDLSLRDVVSRWAPIVIAFTTELDLLVAQQTYRALSDDPVVPLDEWFAASALAIEDVHLVRVVPRAGDTDLGDDLLDPGDVRG